tara:strand:- start:219 stop:455 length:237 start_codon:yes stop_codon:yes gene_type:complete
VSIGGLSFNADKLIVTDSNINWSSENVENLYGKSSGSTSGTLGRFSGNLSLIFKKKTEMKINKLDFSCKNFKMKDRKF